MIIVLENNLNHTNLIVDALVEQQIEKDSIHTFQTLNDAYKFVSHIDKRSAAPIAIIADIALDVPYRTGINFIQTQYEDYVNLTGGGIWTFLVSEGDLISPFGLPVPLPHGTFDKKKEGWHRQCAKVVSNLCLKSLPFDGENDLAPPKSLVIPPADRIYLFSSGEARRLYLQDDETREPLFGVQSPHPHYFDEVNPIMMYRGHYVVIGDKRKAGPPHFVRMLLRWRRVSLAPCYGDGNFFDKRINVRQIHSWTFDPDVDDLVLDEDRGFHVRSAQNPVYDLRRHEDVQRLCNFLFNGSSKKELPAFPTRSGFGKVTQFDDPKFNGFLLPFPASQNADRQITDCFMARLHFVLTDEEVNNYEEWKQEWQQRFPAPGVPKQTTSR